jgi:hypothetical protein
MYDVAAQARLLQVQLLQRFSRATVAERKDLLDAMSSVARGSANTALALAARRVLEVAR